MTNWTPTAPTPPWQQAEPQPVQAESARAPAPAKRERRQAPQAQPWGRPAPEPAAPVATVAPSLSVAPTVALAPAELVPADAVPVDAAERIRAVACKGGSLKGLHALFGVGADVFKRWMDDDPGLRKAFDEGKEQEREQLHRTMYEAAIYRKDLSAAQFLLKTRHGYREQEPEDTRNSVRIIFNIPAAAPDVKTYMEQTALQELVSKPRRPLVLDHE